MTKESKNQRDIILLGDSEENMHKLRLFRANVGTGWTGNKKDTVYNKKTNMVIIRNPRRFSTGLPVGFSDLFGFKKIKITKDMVGKYIAQFTAIEVKSSKGRATKEQKNFIKMVKQFGGLTGVAKSKEEAECIIELD